MPEYNNCEEFRKWVLHKVKEERALGYGRDDSWDLDSFDGELGNQGWAERGHYCAVRLIKKTAPTPDETIDIYAKRLESALEALKDEFCRGTDDEDGFGAGAVMDFIVIVQKLSK